jgi:hypothetical protein
MLIFKTMRPNLLICCLALLLSVSASAIAQEQYSIPACRSGSKSKLGGLLKLSLPKGAIVKKGHDVDYEDYSVGFGKEEKRVWLSGIYGPLASSGRAPKDWIAASSKASQLVWKFRRLEGADAKGRLANGNYWRYFGQYGESIRYYDAPAEAAAYFDKIVASVCFLEKQ